MESLVRDLRLALRNALRAPAFSALVIGILAVGLGSSITVFSLVKAILLDPLDFDRPGELVFLQETKGGNPTSIAYPNFRDWRARQSSFEHLGAYAERTMNLTGTDEPARLYVIRANAALFQALGVPPLIGRALLSEDDRSAAEPVVVVSHSFWSGRLGGDPGVLGRRLVLDEEPHTVVGVMPEGFRFPYFSGGRVDLWVPLGLFEDEWNMRHRADHPGLRAIGRLRDDIEIEAARADLAAIAAALEREYPETNADSGVELTSLRGEVVGPARSTLGILAAAVAFMLLIVVTNSGSLLLVRATGRRRELAIRAALGAGRGRLLRHLLVEGMVLGVAGGVVGLGLAAAGLAALATLAGGSLPRMAEAGLDGGVVIAGLAMASLSGVLLGLIPATLIVRGDLRRHIGGQRSAGGDEGGMLRDALVVTEVVIAVALLVGAGLTGRSLARMLGDDPGIRTDGVLTARVSLPELGYEDPENVRDFLAQLDDELARIPGVDAAGTIWPLPLTGNTWGRWYHVEGEPPADPAAIPVAGFGQVSPGTFEAMGMPILRGRGFTTADGRRAPLVAVVDERFAARWWPESDPLGKRFKLGTHDDDAPWREIVGVVPNVRFRGVAAGTREQVWVPVQQDANRYQALVLRTDGDPTTLVPWVREAVAGIDARLPVFTVRTLADYHAATADRERTLAILVSGFALVGQLLAALGLYGVLAFTVARRQHEIGLRMALGARGEDVVRLVVGQGARLLGIGLGIGLLLGHGIARWLASELYGVGAADPAVLLVVVAVVTVAGLASSCVPSLRAVRIDPMESLRQD